LGMVVYISYRFSIRSNSIYKHKSEPMLIGISGDSGSGKSTLLGDLTSLFGRKILHMEGDGDHKWERGNMNWDRLTHLDPKANYLHKQAENLLHLKMGYSTLRRDYDHSTGMFTPVFKIQPKDYVIICGLHAFYLPKVRKLLDLKIFVNTDENLRIHWKMLRDTKKRGYSRDKIIAQIQKRYDDGEKFIVPQKNFADLIVRYYADNDFEVGDEQAELDLRMEVKLNANIDMEAFTEKWLARGLEMKWDYSDDMANQILNFSDEKIETRVFEELSHVLIPNTYEVIDSNQIWSEGFRGILQLVVAVVIAEQKKKDLIDDII